MNNIILACDTSTTICSVALQVQEAIYTEEHDTNRSHAAHIIPIINRILRHADISIRDVDLCVCSRGPGSFMGLRIAFSTMKGFYAALRVPFVTVMTHQIYAKAYATLEIPIIAVIQATKMYLFVVVYLKEQEIYPLQQMTIQSLSEVIHSCTSTYHATPIITSVDSSLLKYIEDIARKEEWISDAIFQSITSSAAMLCNLGHTLYANVGMDAIDINPYYFRPIGAKYPVSASKD